MNELRALWVDLASASRTHLWVRLAAAGGGLLFVLALLVAGGGHWVTWVGLAVLAVLVAAAPAGLLPVTFVLVAIGAWWAGVEGPWHWALLPAALGLLVLHAGCALAAAVPPQAPVPASVLRLAAVRTGWVAAAATVLWGLAGGVGAIATGAGGPIPGILGLVVLVIALVIFVRAQSGTERVLARQR